MHDYECTNKECKHLDGYIVSLVNDKCPEEVECDECGSPAIKVFLSCASTLTTIIPAYHGSKKKKAGYSHTHSDRPKTHVQGKGWDGGSK